MSKASQSNGKTTGAHKEKTAEEMAGRIWRECPVPESSLFEGQDEVGRRGWFLRLETTGLHPRRIGPFAAKDEALAVLERVLEVVTEKTDCEVINDLKESQVCIVESIPQLRPAVAMTA
jgi:hypothetical protein